MTIEARSALSDIDSNEFNLDFVDCYYDSDSDDITIHIYEEKKKVDKENINTPSGIICNNTFDSTIGKTTNTGYNSTTNPSNMPTHRSSLFV
jgi:hypothetical protein